MLNSKLLDTNFLDNRYKIKFDELIDAPAYGEVITKTLAHPYTDYDLLVISWAPYTSSQLGGVCVLPTSLLYTSDNTIEDEDFQSDTVKKAVVINFPSTTQIRLVCTYAVTWNANSTCLVSVKGIKFN